MKLRQLALILTVFALVSQTYAQMPAKSPEDTEKEKELRTNAVALLRETAGEADLLRIPVNRLSARIEIAFLLSVVDQTEAFAMFRTVMDDFENPFASLDAQFALLKIGPDEYGMQNDSFEGGADGGRTAFLTEFSRMLDFRRRIAEAVAEFDGAAAFEFCDRTAAMIVDPKRNRELTEKDRSFKVSLLSNLAAKNPQKAVQLARKTLTGGMVGKPYFDLAAKIYITDAELGADFMNELIGKVRDGGADSFDFVAVDPWLTERTRVETQAGKPPFINDRGRRILAEIAADSLLALDVERARYRASMSIDAIDKYAPTKAAQIRKRYGISQSKTETDGIPSETVIRAAVREGRVPNGPGNPNASPSPTPPTSNEPPANRISAEREQLMKLKNGTEKLSRLVNLAISAATEDRKTALEILGDARSLVAETPKKADDYRNLAIIAAGYTALEPDKAFEIFESMIPGLNRVIEALMTFGEFLDRREQDIRDDEFQFGRGNSSILSDISRSTRSMHPIFKNLAKVDFARMRAMADKFDRREFRILAKMMVASAILAPENKSNDVKKSTENTGG